MEEQTGFNGFEPSDYANGLYEDAKVNSQRRGRLQRRLDKLTREQRQDLKHQMKQRIFKAGIEYYEARAKYCYYLAVCITLIYFNLYSYLKIADCLPIYALFIENTHPDITHEWIL